VRYCRPRQEIVAQRRYDAQRCLQRFPVRARARPHPSCNRRQYGSARVTADVVARSMAGSAMVRAVRVLCSHASYENIAGGEVTGGVFLQAFTKARSSFAASQARGVRARVAYRRYVMAVRGARRQRGTKMRHDDIARRAAVHERQVRATRRSGARARGAVRVSRRVRGVQQAGSSMRRQPRKEYLYCAL